MVKRGVVSTEPTLEPGRLIAGRYRLIAEVGKGGMGSVWRATVETNTPTSSRAGPSQGQREEVALKLVLPSRMEGSDAKRDLAIGRFAREAQALSRLRNPNVVTLYDHGSDEGVMYIAMELLRGESLSERLKRVKQLDAGDTVRLFNHVGRALDLAHQSGIVHRDLKPGNIFLSRQPSAAEDVAKVLDFGLVKSVGVPLMTVDVHTKIGALLGTPYYMAPEQARARPDVDHRADLWSLGVIAFECLCGVKPFRGKVLAKVIAQIVSGAPPVPSEIASVPAGFDEWFARSVHREPDQRFQSAGAMMDELREVLVDAAISTRLARRRRLEAEVSNASLVSDGMPQTAPLAGARDPLPLIGREAEIADLDRRMDTGVRVLTLTGPPGVGKTRLAREVSKRWQEERALPCVAAWLDDADGDPWCWLELGHALDMDGCGEPAIPNVARTLRALGRAVVMLDGVDHARGLVGQAISTWMFAAPEVHFLITASEPLGIPGETVIPVRPLPQPLARIRGLRELMDHPAPALFMMRAVRHNREVLTLEGKADDIARFVSGFGGLPMALHLGSGLVAERSLDELAASLSAELARPGGTSLVDPNTTLDIAVAWMFKGLPFAERSALTQLSVFRDGFTLDAAEAVVDGEWRHIRRPYEIVLDLAGRGLLLHEEPLVGESRYKLPRPLWRHAASVLADPNADLEPEARDAHVRHATHFAGLGAPSVLEPLLHRGGLVRRTRLGLEAQNLRQALAFCVANQDSSRGVPVALALAATLLAERLPSAAAVTMDEALRLPSVGTAERLRLERMRGQAYRQLRRHDLAAQAFESARRCAEELGDLASESLACAELSLTATTLADHHGSHHACVRAIERAGNDVQAQGLASQASGALSLDLGRLHEAIAALEHAVACHQASGDRPLEAASRALLGEALAEAGLDDRAIAELEAAHARYGEFGARLDQVRTLAWLGEVQSRRSPSAAHRTLERAAARAREIGAYDVEAFHLGLWALSLLERGDWERAVRGVRRAEELLQGDTDAHRLLVIYLCRSWLAICSMDDSAAEIEARHVEQCVHASRLRPLSRLGRAVERLRRALKR